MNLLIKTSVLYLLVALLVFTVGGLVAQRLIGAEVQKETDYSLRDSYFEIRKAINNDIPLNALNTSRIRIDSLNWSVLPDTSIIFSDTLGPHPRLDRLEPYRKLYTTKLINGQLYRVQIQDVFLELDDIYDVVVKIMTRLFLLLGIALLLALFFGSRLLLRPFRQTLNAVQGFKVTDNELPAFPKTSTREFKQLNNFIHRMMQKAQRDYRSLKEFSENASHEIQTPLAIARGKLELLVEDQHLNSEQFQLVQTAQSALARLSKMSEALLLLNRIDNNTLLPRQKTDISILLKDALLTFSELAEMKGLRMEQELQAGVEQRIDPALAEVLINNLLKNAVRHNIEGGWIKVELTPFYLRISNTGPQPTVPTEQFFNRFQKNNPSGSSSGLGLAIVKKVCEVHNFTIAYDYMNQVHTINVGLAS